VPSRGARSARTSRSGTGRGAGALLRDERTDDTRSSTRVFHSPHDGHWPCHLGVWAPQAEQENTELGLGTCRA
jgi:hypothetical protein